MTTNCDLEELKHIAQQKFLELVESGAEWKEGFCFGSGIYYSCDGFRTYNSGGVYFHSHCIWGKPPPVERQAKKNKDGSYNKQDVARAKKEHAEALAEYNAHPMVKAFCTIVEQRRKAEKQKRCKELQSALESHCKGLQKALADTATTLPAKVQTGHTEPYSKPQRYPKERRYWWQFWRGL